MRMAVLLFALLAGCTAAADLDAARTFEEANRLYLAGEHDKAAAHYEALLEHDGLECGALLYNLGNAHMQAGRKGRAIAAYRRALRYRPTDPRLNANLDSALGGERDDERSLFHHVLFWHRSVSYGGKFHLLAAMATLAFLLGLIRRARPAAWIALGLTVLLGASALLAYVEVDRTEHGVVVAEKATARKGNAESFEAAFTDALPEGTEFIVAERRGDWLRIVVGKDLEGWIPTRDATTY